MHQTKEQTYFVNEQHARDQFSHALVNIPAHNLVDLPSQLVRDLGLLRLHQLAHHAHNILSALRPRVRDIQIMQRHVLHHLFLLVHLSLRHRHVLFCFEVEFCGVGV